MGHPKRGRVTVRWSKSEGDFLVAWGPGPGRLKGPAGGFLAEVTGGGGHVSDRFLDELRRMGFDPTTFRAQIDCATPSPSAPPPSPAPPPPARESKDR